MQGDPNAPSLGMGFSRDFSPLGKLHSSHSSSSQGLPAGQLSQASKSICQPEELREKPIFRVIVTGSSLSPLQSCLVPPCYSIYCSSKKNHWNISLPLKIQKKKKIFKRYGEKSSFTMTFRAKRETTSYRSLESYLWQNISNKLFLQRFSAVIYLF